MRHRNKSAGAGGFYYHPQSDLGNDRAMYTDRAINEFGVKPAILALQ